MGAMVGVQVEESMRNARHPHPRASVAPSGRQVTRQLPLSAEDARGLGWTAIEAAGRTAGPPRRVPRGQTYVDR